MLRPGNVHSADRWKELLEPIVARYERKTVRQYFRGSKLRSELQTFQKRRRWRRVTPHSNRLAPSGNTTSQKWIS